MSNRRKLFGDCGYHIPTGSGRPRRQHFPSTLDKADDGRSGRIRFPGKQRFGELVCAAASLIKASQGFAQSAAGTGLGTDTASANTAAKTQGVLVRSARVEEM
jgi:hypothetical protein